MVRCTCLKRFMSSLFCLEYGLNATPEIHRHVLWNDVKMQSMGFDKSAYLFDKSSIFGYHVIVWSCVEGKEVEWHLWQGIINGCFRICDGFSWLMSEAKGLPAVLSDILLLKERCPTLENIMRAFSFPMAAAASASAVQANHGMALASAHATKKPVNTMLLFGVWLSLNTPPH